jgi:sialic acid synthase SpsE
MRIDIALGDGKKSIKDVEISSRTKMGKSIYTSKALSSGHVLTEKDIVLKSPGGGLPSYHLNRIIGKKLKVELPEEAVLSLEHLE